jgi:hypothetical protein
VKDNKTRPRQLADDLVLSVIELQWLVEERKHAINAPELDHALFILKRYAVFVPKNVNLSDVATKESWSGAATCLKRRRDGLAFVLH